MHAYHLCMWFWIRLQLLVLQKKISLKNLLYFHLPLFKFWWNVFMMTHKNCKVFSIICSEIYSKMMERDNNYCGFEYQTHGHDNCIAIHFWFQKRGVMWAVSSWVHPTQKTWIYLAYSSLFLIKTGKLGCFRLAMSIFLHLLESSSF